MIFPNMGTMLGFIFTDLNISNQLLKLALKNNLDKTFNAVSVDGILQQMIWFCFSQLKKQKIKKLLVKNKRV